MRRISSCVGVLAITVLAAACTSDHASAPTTTAAPPTTAPATAATAAAPTTVGSPTTEAGAAGFPSDLPVTVDAGGPYQGSTGAEITLTGSFSVTGQHKQEADLAAIAAALTKYEAANGSFPPAALADASGKALLSWRVLLLPYLGEEALYRKFDLTKAWDDPANQPLLSQMPAVYQGDGGGASGNTAYAGVAGAKQVFRSPSASLGGGVRRQGIVDGLTMTFAVGPVSREVSLAWTAPGDVQIAQHETLGSPQGFAGTGRVATPMAFLDGKVHTLLNDTDEAIVNGWSTIAGGGCDPPDSLDAGLRAAWDLDGNGSFESTGAVATLASPTAGTHAVSFRVVDRFGGVHVASTKVVVP